MGWDMGWHRGGNMRNTHQLTSTSVKNLKAKGLYPDGDGLYLQITVSGTKSWVYRYGTGGRLRDMGLGRVVDVSLAEARDLARRARQTRREGKDPIDERSHQRARAAHANGTSFKYCAEQLIADRDAGWGSARHRQQWRNTMTEYVYPVLGDVSVDKVDTELVLRVLRQPVEIKVGKSAPFWEAKTVTASRVRSRIEAVLSAAKARGLRNGAENPAMWRGHLDHLLPRRSKVQPVRHHPALPYRDIPAFMPQLQAHRRCHPAGS